jgi:hypothetical protein
MPYIKEFCNKQRTQWIKFILVFIIVALLYSGFQYVQDEEKKSLIHYLLIGIVAGTLGFLFEVVFEVANSENLKEELYHWGIQIFLAISLAIIALVVMIFFNPIEATMDTSAILPTLSAVSTSNDETPEMPFEEENSKSASSEILSAQGYLKNISSNNWNDIIDGMFCDSQSLAMPDTYPPSGNAKHYNIHKLANDKLPENLPLLTAVAQNKAEGAFLIQIDANQVANVFSLEKPSPSEPLCWFWISRSTFFESIPQENLSSLKTDIDCDESCRNQ